uniref:NADH-ubiquinone oxidoreductase chain 4 n=1 Tax=Mexistrophia reticulata TaxID=1780250 RepID=A0A1W6S4J1_9EUPU|nr:NADH dehydrogenase subunit 4 [Mexistrophia reticulata]
MSVMFVMMTSFFLIKYRFSLLIQIVMMTFAYVFCWSRFFHFSLLSKWLMSGSMNMMLTWLSFFIFSCAMLSTIQVNTKNYWLISLSLMGFLFLCFSVSNLLSFYIVFEASLIPILLLIITWGYQPERLQAGTYMIMYTVLGSLPMLLIVLILQNQLNTLSIMLLKYEVTPNINFIIYLVLMLPFLFKLPIYGAHLWLPKAHVEAPLLGSMVLAGVLLKLGGYGLYLLMIMMDCVMLTNSSFLFVCLIAMWGSFLATFMCMQQNDLKAMVAYSSVVHMGSVVMCLISGSSWGLVGALIIMVSHGFTSSLMFLMASLTYKISHSRSLCYTSGLLKSFPLLSLMWFICCAMNMAAPPTLNLVGELFSLAASWLIGISLLLLMVIIMFMSVGYNMYLYSLTNHGQLNVGLLPNLSFMGSNGCLAFMLHLAALFLVFCLNNFNY